MINMFDHFYSLLLNTFFQIWHFNLKALKLNNLKNIFCEIFEIDTSKIE